MSPLQQQINGLGKRLADYEKITKLSQARALNLVTKKSKSKLAKSVSADVKIKQSILKKQVFTGRATSSSLLAYVRSYLRPIAASRLLSPSQLQKAPRGTNRKGVRVAGKQFDGAFINRGRKDRKHHVLMRKGRARYPLKRISIKISDSVSAHQLPIAENMLRQDFVRLYEHELNYRTSKYARRTQSHSRRYQGRYRECL